MDNNDNNVNVTNNETSDNLPPLNNLDETNSNLQYDEVTNKENGLKAKKNIGLIITVILGIIIMYWSFYTVYYVFFVPSESRNSNNQIVEDVSLLIEKANDLLDLVPSLINHESAYQYSPAIYDNVDSETLFYTLLNLYDKKEDKTYVNDLNFSEFKTENCLTEDYCFGVNYNNLDELLKIHYGINLVLEKKDYILSDTNSCIYENNSFYCVYKNYDEEVYNGIISVIENARESEETFTIYESAIFVENFIMNQNNIQIGSVNILPDITSNIDNDVIFTYKSDYEDELINKYSSQKKMYKHEFKLVDNEYVWIKTSPANSIEY